MDKRIIRWADKVLGSGGQVYFESHTDVALVLTMAQFEAKIMTEDNGRAMLVYLHRDKSREAERRKLLRPYLKGGCIYFEVPRWFDLTRWLREKLKNPSGPGCQEA